VQSRISVGAACRAALCGPRRNQRPKEAATGVMANVGQDRNAAFRRENARRDVQARPGFAWRRKSFPADPEERTYFDKHPRLHPPALIFGKNAPALNQGVG